MHASIDLILTTVDFFDISSLNLCSMCLSTTSRNVNLSCCVNTRATSVAMFFLIALSSSGDGRMDDAILADNWKPGGNVFGRCLVGILFKTAYEWK